MDELRDKRKIEGRFKLVKDILNEIVCGIPEEDFWNVVKEVTGRELRYRILISSLT